MDEQKIVELLEQEGFATTHNIEDAIYILRDGTLIDGGFDVYGNRGIDHRMIEIFIDGANRYDNDFWSKVHTELGVVMLIPETKEILIMENQKLTPEQWNWVAKLKTYQFQEYCKELPAENLKGNGNEIYNTESIKSIQHPTQLQRQEREENKMKRINGYWIDESENCWDSKIYSEQEAQQASKSLVNCYKCVNCADCENCHHNQNCRDCQNSYDCHDCFDCVDCNCCKNCLACVTCSDCHDCSNCHNCSYCHNCHNCYYCQDFIEQPKSYTTRIVDESTNPVRFYHGKTSDGKMSFQVNWNAFSGNLKDFESLVQNVYSSDEKTRNRFLQEIAKAKTIKSMQQSEFKSLDQRIKAAQDSKDQFSKDEQQHQIGAANLER